MVVFWKWNEQISMSLSSFYIHQGSCYIACMYHSTLYEYLQPNKTWSVIQSMWFTCPESGVIILIHLLIIWHDSLELSIQIVDVNAFMIWDIRNCWSCQCDCMDEQLFRLKIKSPVKMIWRSCFMDLDLNNNNFIGVNLCHCEGERSTIISSHIYFICCGRWHS